MNNALFIRTIAGRLAIIALFLTFSFLSVQAATFVVTKTADTNDGVCDADCSLREAIAAANAAASNDVIEFDMAVFSSAQAITLGGTQLVIQNNGTLTINGTGANLLSLDGNSQSRIFSINSSTVAVINNVTIKNGRVPGMITGDRGGGILNVGGNLTVNNSVISNNRTFDGGGGIYNFGIGTLTVNNSTIKNNITDSSAGGGIHNADGSTLNVNNTVISGNTAPSGGGIYNSVWAFINNSTISGNTVPTFGGGIVNDGGSSTTCQITNSTISNNNAGFQGGGVWRNTGAVTLKNTIVANNTANTAPDFRSTLTSEGYNLIEDTSGTTITGTTTGNIIGVDPQLLPLGNYGGTTQTHALRPTSPAIDKGKSFGITTDQRGRTRPFDNPNIPNSQGGDGADIGAFERQSPDTPAGVVFDFDGDTKTDISIFRPAVGEWWFLRSSDGGNNAVQFGTSTDRLVPADFTGDGKTDIAFWRESSGEWFILRSEDSSYYAFPFGSAGDIPAPGDFDGDGKADAAVFRPSNATWYILRSSDGGITIQQFGISEDKPVVADYDGDGKDDIGIYRPSVSEWWIFRSSLGLKSLQFGQTGDKTVQGDYTGDGKADLAFYRPSTGEWFILRSEDDSYYAFPFGTAGDIPAPGDYDGDGKFDAAVFRPSTSTWYLQRSSSGFAAIGFGTNGDVPIPNAFVR